MNKASTLGYRMPAEWEPHEATWLTWPHNEETWPDQNMNDVESVYLQIIRGLHKGEKINILVQDSEKSKTLSEQLNSEGLNNYKLHIIPTDDSWIRDYGPNFVVRENSSQREVAINKWGFDSWGGKYEWEKDNQAGMTISESLGLKLFQPGIVLEGGAIEVNGQGTCITTEQCLLNPNRNSGMNKSKMESYLKDYLEVTNIIWCQGELEGDDTDGHIDNLARFVSPDTVLCACSEDPADPNKKCLDENLRILESAHDQNGKPINVVRLPMPGYVGDKNNRLPASYANFYIGNKSVLLPTYGQSTDLTVNALLQKFFPEREVVPIPCETFVWGLGAIHCVTQQQPAG